MLSPNQLRLAGPALRITSFDFIQKTIHLPQPTVALSPQEAVVLTSTTAVRAWLEITKQPGQDLENCRIYCLAFATLALAVQHSLSIAGVAPDASSLAGVMLEDSSIRSVTFVGSNLRRPELPDKLRSQGVRVREIEAYRTEFTPVRVEQPYDGILFFSPSTVDSFLSLNDLSMSVCFCLGNTTARHAQKSGFTKTVVPEIPTVQALLEKLISWYPNPIARAEK